MRLSLSSLAKVAGLATVMVAGVGVQPEADACSICGSGNTTYYEWVCDPWYGWELQVVGSGLWSSCGSYRHTWGVQTGCYEQIRTGPKCSYTVCTPEPTEACGIVWDDTGGVIDPNP